MLRGHQVSRLGWALKVGSADGGTTARDQRKEKVGGGCIYESGFRSATWRLLAPLLNSAGFCALPGGLFIRLNPESFIIYLQSTALPTHSYTSAINGERLIHQSEEKDISLLGMGAVLHRRMLSKSSSPHLLQGLSHPAAVTGNWEFLAGFPS